MKLAEPIRGSGNGGCLVGIKTVYRQMTAKEQMVADYVLAHEDVIYNSITEVARLSGAGYGSVARFCKRLGYKGFQDFKIDLAEDVALHKDIRARSDSSDLVTQVEADSLRDIRETVRTLSREGLEESAKALANAGTVLVAGCGGSAVTAMEIEYRLTRFGIKAAAVCDGHMQCIRATTLREGDVAFLVSFSGSTREILTTGQIAKDAGARVICLTNFAESPVAEIADHLLVTGIHVDPLSAEVVSKAGIHFVIEALFRRILALRKECRKFLLTTFETIADRQL